MREARLVALLRGDTDEVAHWMAEDRAGWLLRCGAAVVLGTAAYGAVIGVWRSPLQAAFVAAKFPLLIALTTMATAVLNWMLALVLGARLSFGRTLAAQFNSYAVASLILAALAPVALFVTWHLPAVGTDRQTQSHSLVTLMHVAMIAWAGIEGMRRLGGLLAATTGSRALARRVLAAWMAANLFVGAQLSWTLRPFMGSPALEVRFLRPNAFEGNFYEDVANKAAALLTPPLRQAVPLVDQRGLQDG